MDPSQSQTTPKGARVVQGNAKKNRRNYNPKTKQQSTV